MWLVRAAVVVALLVPGVARAAGDIYTVAGFGPPKTLSEGGPATASSLGSWAGIGALPDGGFLLTDVGRVRRVDPSGRVHTVAGTGQWGFAGDGGPALAARVDPTDVAALPGGGFLIAECDNNRIRRVAVDGTITTVAGSGPIAHGPYYTGGGFAGDGGPATLARLACPAGVAPTADGGIVIADYGNRRVRRVTPDGRIATVAGTGDLPDAGQVPLTTAKRTPISADGVAVAADGTVLVADSFAARVWRVFPGGTIGVAAGTGEGLRRNDDGRLATLASVDPFAVAALPAGGFLVADEGDATAGGEEPRVREVDPSGIIRTVAGTGRFVPDPPRRLERRGDGGPARLADLLPVRDVAEAADGGILISEGIFATEPPRRGRIRYVTPAAAGRFAAALRRDRDRLFKRGRQVAVSVALTAPALVELSVIRGGRRGPTIRRALPAGTSRVVVAEHLAAVPHEVAMVATDAGGRIATDRFGLAPVGWLSDTLSEYVAVGVIFSARLFPGGYEGNGVLGCRRLGRARLDCRISDDGKSCDGVAAISLRSGRLWWGSYRCPIRSRPHWIVRPHRLARRDFSCIEGDTSCPPPLFGPLRPSILALPD